MISKFIVLVLGAVSLASAPLVTAGEVVEYAANGTVLKGYLAKPTSGQDKLHGAVLVVHEWWGQNDYPRRRADMLAELGYTALALDMYGGGKVANHPKDAGKFAGAVRKNLPLAEQRFRAALEVLKSQPYVDATRIAAIGYCFGGSMVLEMAGRGLPLAAVASFHGSLGGVSPPSPGVVRAKALVANGAADKFIKPDQIAAFKQQWDSAGADYVFIDYPGALHGFTNPDATAAGKKFNIPIAYDAQADAQSWAAMRELFARTID